MPRAYNFLASAVDHVDLDSDITISGDQTYSFWINFTAFTGNRTIFGRSTGADYCRFVIGATTYTFNWRTDNVDTDIDDLPNLTAGVWNHVVITRSGSTVTLLIGSLGVPPTSVGTVTDAEDPQIIGRLAARDADVNALNGKMFDFRIYDSAISATHIAIANDFRFPSGLALLHYWQMQDTDATVMEDLAAGNQDGTKDVTLPAFHYQGGDVPHDYNITKDSISGRPDALNAFAFSPWWQ